MILSPRFESAFAYACAAHGGQLRKGKSVPYLAHLMAVSSLVLEFGGSEDEAIGAMLHDVVEDAGGAKRLEHLRVRFGDDVAAIVAGCSDSITEETDGPKAPWKDRKTAYIEGLRKKSASIRFVSCADKLHNLTDIVRDCRRRGPETLKRFNAPPQDLFWYYDSLLQGFRTSGTQAEIVEELAGVVGQFGEIVRNSRPP